MMTIGGVETTVTGLIEEHGRVAGVRTVHRGRESVLTARLVVGADAGPTEVEDSAIAA
jgi:2-polyprenyl-6-methoxyphenol hydroxylase-like FAD-dependent oxidoreductase